MQRRAETDNELWCGACKMMHRKSAFTRASASPSGYNYACKDVISIRNRRSHAHAAEHNNKRHARRRAEVKQQPDAREWALKKMLAEARRRATLTGIDFSITRDDLQVPDICPVFGFKLIYQANRVRLGESASLDRIDPRKGYSKNNVWIISWRANRIKADATVEELQSIVAALIGKHRSGRLLDGRTHDEVPEVGR